MISPPFVFLVHESTELYVVCKTHSFRIFSSSPKRSPQEGTKADWSWKKDPPLPGTHTLLIVVNVIQAQKELK